MIVDILKQKLPAELVYLVLQFAPKEEFIKDGERIICLYQVFDERWIKYSYESQYFLIDCIDYRLRDKFIAPTIYFKFNRFYSNYIYIRLIYYARQLIERNLYALKPSGTRSRCIEEEFTVYRPKLIIDTNNNVFTIALKQNNDIINKHHIIFDKKEMSYNSNFVELGCKFNKLINYNGRDSEYLNSICVNFKYFIHNSYKWVIEDYERVNLKIPFNKKDEAKRHDCKWDGELKTWYTYKSNPYIKNI